MTDSKLARPVVALNGSAPRAPSTSERAEPLAKARSAALDQDTEQLASVDATPPETPTPDVAVSQAALPAQVIAAPVSPGSPDTQAVTDTPLPEGGPNIGGAMMAVVGGIGLLGALSSHSSGATPGSVVQAPATDHPAESPMPAASTVPANPQAPVVPQPPADEPVPTKPPASPPPHEPDAPANLVDITPPQAPSLQLANASEAKDVDHRPLVEDGTIQVNGLEDGATWKYSLDGGVHWIDGQGHQIDGTVFQAGAQAVEVIQRDAAGNDSDPVTLAFSVGHVPGALTTVFTNDDHAFVQQDATGNPVSHADILVQGLEPNATFKYSVDGDKTWTHVTAPDDDLGGFGIRHQDLGPDGSKHIDIVQIDTKGNEGLAAAVDFSLDTTPPSVAPPTLSLASDTGSDGADGVSRIGTINIAGAQDADTGWLVTWHGDKGDISAIVPPGQQTVAAPTEDGHYNVEVRAVDAAGNQAADSSSISLTLDSTAPSAPALTLKSDTGVSTTDHLTSDGTVLIGNLEDHASWKYSLDDGQHWTVGTGAAIAGSVFPAEGTQSVKVIQTDLAGNDSTESTLEMQLYPDHPLIPTGTDHEATGTSGADRFVLTHQQGDDFFFMLHDFSTQQGDVIDLSNLVTIPEGSAAKFVKTFYDDSGHGIEIEIDLDGKGEFGRGAEVKAYAYTDGPSDLFFVHGGGVIKA